MSSSDDALDALQLRSGKYRKSGNGAGSSRSASIDCGNAGQHHGKSGVKTRLLIHKRGKNDAGFLSSGSSSRGGVGPGPGRFSAGSRGRGSRSSGNLAVGIDSSRRNYSPHFTDEEDEDPVPPRMMGVDNPVMSNSHSASDVVGVMASFKPTECIRAYGQFQSGSMTGKGSLGGMGGPVGAVAIPMVGSGSLNSSSTSSKCLANSDNNIMKFRAKVTTLEEIVNKSARPIVPTPGPQPLPTCSSSLPGIIGMSGGGGVEEAGKSRDEIRGGLPRRIDGGRRGVGRRSQSASAMLSINKPSKRVTVLAPSETVRSKSALLSSSACSSSSRLNEPGSSKSSNFRSQPQILVNETSCTSLAGPPYWTTNSGAGSLKNDAIAEESMSEGGDSDQVGEERVPPPGHCCDVSCWCCGCQGSSNCVREENRGRGKHGMSAGTAGGGQSRRHGGLGWSRCWTLFFNRMPNCFHSALGFVAKIYWRLIDGVFGIEPPYRDHNGEETERLIRANDPAFNSKYNYANNLIKTSKYSVLTFLPLNLFEQFQRLANFYFLCLLVLQMIPVITSLTPLTTGVPLFLVLALTAVKDAYDDFQRHRSDSQVNNRKSLVLRNGQLQEERWHKVQVGDVIRMENDQFVAADVLLLSSSEPNGLTFIETAELDGETNLKCRQCLLETAEMGQEPEKLGSFDGDIICEPPNNHLNKFEGNLTWRGKKYPLDNDKVLLRGCILRNTQWCYGVVLFAGQDTKLMQNSGKTKFKRTSIDRLLNFIILGIVFFLLSMCLFCTIACAVWETMIGQYFRQYLPWDNLIPVDAVEGAVIISLLVFFSYAIILNTVVPISLYVSVEVIRLLQSFLINWDLKMYHEASDTPAKARTTTLNEELGQIEYIFSDKTGTLTQNIMTFNKCSIGGKSYGEVIDPQTGEVIEQMEQEDVKKSRGKTEGEEIEMKVVTWADERETGDGDALAEGSGEKRDSELNEKLLPETSFSSAGGGNETNIEQHNVAPIDFSKNPYYENKFRFYDRTLLDAVKKGDPDVHMFFRHLALCHTVMADERNGHLEYQAQSPDENALVSAARNFEFVFKERSPDSITISVQGKEEVYDLLCILDFNNVRKRMSVVVQKDDKILLLCKGADSIIYERLQMGSEDIKSRTQEHLNKYAGEGLRTLVLAVKELTPEYFDDWKRRHHEAASSLGNREEKLDAIYEEIEREMTLIGTTAVEDKLQDGVPATIANLMVAGIKVWVLTGDKQETAMNIGYSCQLLTDEMNDIFIVDAYSFEEVRVQILKYLDALQRGSSAPVENQRIGDMSMVTFNETEFGPGYHPGDADSSHDQEGNGGYAVIINGHSLVHALHPQLEQYYLELASQCKAVICCRVTPLQKALVVELVKKYKKAVTLAIGDGANDVSMIKTAHIGVGISGQEGLQAVLASDYSIAQFRYLERLLLVHGRWSYYRMAKFLRYFFYKNFAFTLTHFWYAFFCGFSAQTVFDPMFISVYNLFYTSLPVLSIGVFDQDCNDDYSLRYPKLYTPGHRNLLFSKKEFFKSALHGFVTSCVIFIVPYGTYNHAVTGDGQGLSDHMLFGSVVSTILVVVVTTQVALDTSYWTVFNHVTIWGSLLFFFILHYLYNFAIQGKYLGSLTKALQEASFWFTLVLTVMLLIIPVLAWRFYFYDVHPTLSDRVRLKQRLSSAKTRPSGDKSFRTPSARRSRRSLRSSYAFAHQEGFGPLITSGKIMRKAKSNNNHTAGSTVASLVSSVTSFGASTNPAISSSLSKSPRITMVSPQEPKQYHDSVRL